jgi:hypothetical protein
VRLIFANTINQRVEQLDETLILPFGMRHEEPWSQVWPKPLDRLDSTSGHDLTPSTWKAGVPRQCGFLQSGPVAWSTWTFADEDKEPWRAFFVIRKRPDIARSYWVQLLADWVGTTPRANGGIPGSQWGMTSGTIDSS